MNKFACKLHGYIVYFYFYYSADVYDSTWQRLEPLGVETECLGGGRIIHEPDKKHIKVYGYSQVTNYSYYL